MLKLILTSLIIYTLYKFFIKPQLAVPPHNPRQSFHNTNTPRDTPSSKDGEYIEYEELD
jgi:hypothetical protein